MNDKPRRPNVPKPVHKPGHPVLSNDKKRKSSNDGKPNTISESRPVPRPPRGK